MNVLSLCSGIAGLDLGTRLAVPEARTVCFVEIDGYCQRVLAARMSDGSLDPCPIHGDLTAFDGRSWRGSVDCITAGFPCQDISNAGRREGIKKGNRSGLWFEVLRVIHEVGPRCVFLENVSALLVRGLDTVLGPLAESGFSAEWGVFSAADVGAPHLRKRVFILAVADASDERHERSGAARGWGDGFENDLCPLADAQCPERGQDALTRGGRGEGSDGEGQGAVGPGLCGKALADTEEQRRELRSAEGERPGRLAGGDFAVGHAARHLRRASGDGERDALDGSGDLPLFPPGPADRAAWATVLAERPDLAPATAATKAEHGVRAVDDGLSSRVAQLKACGNAVVPLQAALAFTVLAERLRECR